MYDFLANLFHTSDKKKCKEQFLTTFPSKY